MHILDAVEDFFNVEAAEPLTLWARAQVSEILQSLQHQKNLSTGRHPSSHTSQEAAKSCMIAAMNTLKEPKRRNAQETKAKILAAAQKAFSELGYSEVGIRDIAAIAGVDSAMLLRYFGSKAALFEAALIDAMHYFGSKAGLFETALIDAMYLRGVFEKGRSRFGKYLCHLILNANLGINPTSIMALSAGHPEARGITTRVIRERILGPLAKGIGPPRANARALQIVVLSVGFVLHTKVPLTPVSKAVDKSLAAWFARSVQEIVDQPAGKSAR